jgi:hypothetical protein
MVIILQKEAEQHMPFLAMRGGVSIQMEDFDTGHSWNLRYRYRTFCLYTFFLFLFLYESFCKKRVRRVEQ